LGRIDTLEVDEAMEGFDSSSLCRRVITGGYEGSKAGVDLLVLFQELFRGKF
jgi:hypothetical protein